MDAREYAANETLKDGTPVTIRAIRREDAGTILQAFRGLDRESVYRRFFTPKKDLSPAELEQLTDVDFNRVLALVVTKAAENGEVLIAGGRYAVEDPASGAAEIAFMTDGAHRGLGVASCWYGCGNTGLPNPSTVRAGITRDGRLVLHQGATDIGQGSNTVISQIFADAVAADGAWAWVMNGRLGTLYRVDAGSTLVSGETPPLSQRARKSTDAGVDAVEGSVWAAFGDATLARVNPATLDGHGASSTATGPTAVVFAYGSIWVATATNEIQQFSPDSWDLGPLRELTVCRSPIGIAAGNGAIWVACRDDDLVERIAVDLTSESSRSIAVGDKPAAIAFGDGAVWVSNSGDGTVSRIDPETYEVVKTIEVGDAPAGIAFSDGRIWVSVQAPFTP